MQACSPFVERREPKTGLSALIILIHFQKVASHASVDVTALFAV